MIRSALILLMFIAGCGGQVEQSAQPADGADPTVGDSAAIPSIAPPSEQPSPSGEALDPECQAAFEAGLAAMTEDSRDHLDEAIAACDTVENWRAAARMFPDAVGFRVMELVYQRCSGSEDLQESALCVATEADWGS